MVENPLVSIILPVYNGEKYLEQSIESCLNQTYNNIELIVVNDCSTDSSLQIIKRYCTKDTRVKLVNNPINKKLPASLNIGHNFSKGEYITWTSDDNFYDPLAIEVMLETIKSKNVDIVYANYNLIDEQGERVINLRGFGFLIFSNVIGACFLYHSKVYDSNKYEESLFLVEDYDFWLQCLKRYSFYHINYALYNYRSHEESLSKNIESNKEKKSLFLINIERSYKRFFNGLGLENDFSANLFMKLHTSRFSIKNKHEVFRIREIVKGCSEKLLFPKELKQDLLREVFLIQLKLLRNLNHEINYFDSLRFLSQSYTKMRFKDFKIWLKLFMNYK